MIFMVWWHKLNSAVSAARCDISDIGAAVMRCTLLDNIDGLVAQFKFSCLLCSAVHCVAV